MSSHFGNPIIKSFVVQPLAFYYCLVYITLQQMAQFHVLGENRSVSRVVAQLLVRSGQYTWFSDKSITKRLYHHTNETLGGLKSKGLAPAELPHTRFIPPPSTQRRCGSHFWILAAKHFVKTHE